MESAKLTLTVPEAAKLLGLSRQLGYQMVREGKLPAIRFAGRWVVSKHGIAKMLEEAELNARNIRDSSQ